MQDVILCVFLFLVIFVVDLLPLIKKKEKGALGFYLPVLILTMAVIILNGLGVKLPSPSKPIAELVGKLTGAK